MVPSREREREVDRAFFKGPAGESECKWKREGANKEGISRFGEEEEEEDGMLGRRPGTTGGKSKAGAN